MTENTSPRLIEMIAWGVVSYDKASGMPSQKEATRMLEIDHKSKRVSEDFEQREIDRD